MIVVVVIGGVLLTFFFFLFSGRIAAHRAAVKATIAQEIAARLRQSQDLDADLVRNLGAGGATNGAPPAGGAVKQDGAISEPIGGQTQAGGHSRSFADQRSETDGNTDDLPTADVAGDA